MIVSCYFFYWRPQKYIKIRKLVYCFFYLMWSVNKTNLRGIIANFNASLMILHLNLSELKFWAWYLFIFFQLKTKMIFEYWQYLLSVWYDTNCNVPHRGFVKFYYFLTKGFITILVFSPQRNPMSHVFKQSSYQNYFRNEI